MSERLSPGELQALAAIDTCTVANAIESFGVRLRNEGFSSATIRCLTPQLPAVVGYAETLRVRSSSPPWQRRLYFDRTDWWTALAVVPPPRIVVIEDVDPKVGVGAFVGGVHAHILRALGCVAAVTNGAARDVPEAVEAGLHVIAGNVSPSHAYVHVVEYGNPVENIYVRKVERVNGRLQNTVMETFPGVSQFWTYRPDEFLKNPVYGRDYPPCKNCQ